MGWESSDVIRFDLATYSLQGQMRIAKYKSAYTLLIIGPRGFGCETHLKKIMGGSLLMWSDLALGPSLFTSSHCSYSISSVRMPCFCVQKPFV